MTIQSALKKTMERGASPMAAVPVVNGLLALYAGALSSQTPGWELLESKEGEMVQVPFEGSYESKGGRIQSPWIALDKPVGRPAYYRMTFSAQTDAHCYWWVDFEDGEGNPLPDVNSAVYAGDGEQAYDQMLYVMGAAARLRLAFQSTSGVLVKDLSVQRASEAEAADWCDRLYATLPQIDLAPPADAFAKQPRTAAALKDGTPWRIVMLGDSIQNDSFNSIFQALVKRDFPQSNLDFVISVRGGTGCWHYQEPAHFQGYVARHKPDLLLVGGISNIREGKNAEEEVRLRWKPYRDLAKECDVAFWNLTVPTADAIAASRKPHDWFNRDYVHSNDRGKQLIGRELQRHFQAGR